MCQPRTVMIALVAGKMVKMAGKMARNVPHPLVPPYFGPNMVTTVANFATQMASYLRLTRVD